MDNCGWPIGHDPIAKCDSNGDGFAIDEGMEGSDFAKVIFSMKNSGVVVIGRQTAVVKINLDLFK